MTGPRNATPKVSVVIPVHNGQSFISRAVTSVLTQSLNDIEVIVVDDASSDGTPEIIAHLGSSDTRLSLMRCEVNRGPSAARNAGIATARGAWIAILDADDWYRPERLERLITAAEAADADMVSDNIILHNESDDAVIGPMFRSDYLSGIMSAERFVEGNLPNPKSPRRGFGFLKPIIRKHFIAEHSLRYDERMRFGEDYAFYLSCLLEGAKWICVPDTAYCYSVRSHSLTARHDAADLHKLCAVDEAALQHSRVSEEPKLYKSLRCHLVSVQQRACWAQFIDSYKGGEIGSLARAITLNVPVFLYIARQCLIQLYRRSYHLISRPMR